MITVTVSDGSLTADTSFTLTVNAPVPTITDPKTDQTVELTVGGDAVLSVTAENAASYQWQVKQGEVFADIPGASEASLSLSAVGLTDDGAQYRVVAINGSNRVIGPVFTLHVTTPPKTGDSSHMGLWIGLLLLFGGAELLLLKKRVGRE